MLRVSRKIVDYFDRRLEGAAISERERPDYRKWLRFYLDFCDKYGHAPRSGSSLSLFLAKLASKNQSAAQQQEGGTSEIALAVAGFHPATFARSTDCLGLHDLWMFEGLLSSGNSRLHVTSTNFNDPIALKLVHISKRCLSLHGLDNVPGGADIQIGGLDAELGSIILEELAAAGISAAVANQEGTNGNDLKNICNKTTISAGVQLEMAEAYRASLFAPGCNTRELRKNNTTAEFCKLATALRKAMSEAF